MCEVLHDRLCSIAPVISVIIMIALVSGVSANVIHNTVSVSSLANIKMFVLDMQHWLRNHLLSTLSNHDKHTRMIGGCLIALCHFQTVTVH